MADAGPGVLNSVEALVGPRASPSMASVGPAVEPLPAQPPWYPKGSNGTGLRIQMFPGLLAFFL